MGAKPAAGKGLRIASGCSTLDEFTAVFRKFCTPNSIFIATGTPRPSGIEIRFAITLKDGKPVMSGAGTITESFETKENPYERSGMVVEFSKLDTMGRILLRELNATSKPSGSGGKPTKKKSENFEIPTVVSDPDENTLAATRRSEERAAVAPPEDGDGADEASNGDADEAGAEAEGEADGDAEAEAEAPKRAKGSSIILPANPFGELAAQSLEAFIECTLYEETGEIDISAADAAPNPIVEIPLAPPKDAEGLGDLLSDDASDLLSDDAQPAEQKYIPRPPKLPASASVPTPPPTPPTRPKVPDIPMLAPEALVEHEVLVSDKSLDKEAAPVQTAPVQTPAPVQAAPVQTPAPVQAAPPSGAGRQAIALAPLIPTPVMAPPAMAQPAAIAPQNFAVAEDLESVPNAAPQPRTITFTWNQAIGLVALCVVAGLGFGLLASSDGKSKPDVTASQVATAAPANALRTKKNTVAAENAPADTKRPAAPSVLEPTQPGTPPEPTEPTQAPPQMPDAGAVAAAIVALPETPAPEPEPALPPSATTEELCLVAIDMIPKDGIVAIGGTAVQRNAKQAKVPCGSQPLVVTHPRYLDYKQEIEVSTNAPNTLRVRMKRPMIALRVQSTPSKATVIFNKQRVGKAPLKRNIPAFESVQVTVSSPGYQTYKRKIYPKKNTTVNVRLRKLKTTSRRSR